MTNEQIVEKIRCGYSVTDNMQLLYEKNMPLIKRIVKPYTAYENMEDLLQEAYFGLWEAVQHYETSENVLFMTYAGYWLRQVIQRYIENCGSVIRIPTGTNQKIIRYNKTVQKLTQSYGRVPTDIEIQEYMKISAEEVENLKKYSKKVSSLDIPLNEDGEATLGDNIQDDCDLENHVIDKICAEQSEKEIWNIVEHYTIERENRIIKEYFLHNKTMPEIAENEHLSVSRIREIKENGLNRLRNGRARRIILEKFDIAESSIYRNGIGKFNDHNHTSTVEYIAMRRAELKEEYEKRLKECLEYVPQKSVC